MISQCQAMLNSFGRVSRRCPNLKAKDHDRYCTRHAEQTRKNLEALAPILEQCHEQKDKRGPKAKEKPVDLSAATDLLGQMQAISKSFEKKPKTDLTRTCLDCGKQFEFRDEGDNEKYCLSCEAVFMIKVEEQEGEFA